MSRKGKSKRHVSPASVACNARACVQRGCPLYLRERSCPHGAWRGARANTFYVREEGWQDSKVASRTGDWLTTGKRELAIRCLTASYHGQVPHRFDLGVLLLQTDRCLTCLADHFRPADAIQTVQRAVPQCDQMPHRLVPLYVVLGWGWSPPRIGSRCHRLRLQPCKQANW